MKPRTSQKSGSNAWIAQVINMLRRILQRSPMERRRIDAEPSDKGPNERTDLGHLDIGRRGEELAAAYLERIGYRLVASNFKLPVGRNRRGALIHNEIDLVAYDGNTLCFVEVKTRVSDRFAPPEVNVDLRKRRQITRAARVYRRLFGLQEASYRYDVVTVVLRPEGSAAPRIELRRGFWTEESLRKKRWTSDEMIY
jgi:putative endonuclease